MQVMTVLVAFLYMSLFVYQNVYGIPSPRSAANQVQIGKIVYNRSNNSAGILILRNQSNSRSSFKRPRSLQDDRCANQVAGAIESHFNINSHCHLMGCGWLLLSAVRFPIDNVEDIDQKASQRCCALLHVLVLWHLFAATTTSGQLFHMATRINYKIGALNKFTCVCCGRCKQVAL